MSKSIRHLMARPAPDQAVGGASSTESTTSPPLPAGNPPSPPAAPAQPGRFGAAWQAQEQAARPPMPSATAAWSSSRSGSLRSLGDRGSRSRYDRCGLDAFVEQIRDEGQRSPAWSVRSPASPVATRSPMVAAGTARRGSSGVRCAPSCARWRHRARIAQGSENLARADLSYIERAHFAQNMVRAGVTRDVIAKAMGLQTTHLSSLLSVAEAIPASVLAVIGPPPQDRPAQLAHVGRPDQVRDPRADRQRPRLAGPVRQVVERAVRRGAGGARRGTQGGEAGEGRDAEGCQGLKFARVERSTSGVRVTTDEANEPGFGDYLAARLPRDPGRLPGEQGVILRLSADRASRRGTRLRSGARGLRHNPFRKKPAERVSRARPGAR